MKKMLLSILAMSSLTFANNHTGFLNINDTELEAGVCFDTTLIEPLKGSKTGFKFDTSFLQSDEFMAGGLGILSQNRIETMQGSKLGIGIKYFALSHNNDKFYDQLPLALQFKYNFPELMYSIPPVSIDTELLYAPKVLSFNDSEGMSSMRAEVNIEPIENVKIYAGYRTYKIEEKNGGKQKFADDFYGGLKMSF